MENDYRWLTANPPIMPLFGEADGFNGTGLDSEGYNRRGYKPDEEGVMRDRDGYDVDGWKEADDGVLRDRYGFDEDGYDREGFNESGYNEDGYDANGHDCEGYDEDGWNEDGEDRYGESRYHEPGEPAEWLYGNEPDYIFRSTSEEKREAELDGRYTQRKRLAGVPYYGMEIELTSDCNPEVRRIIQQEYSQYVWAKPDCSVDGFEMVTHPMTAKWAQENFPWEIVHELGKNGCEVWQESNGLHIHVSRSGFNGWAHQFRWIKLFYRMKDQIVGSEGLAGRTAGEWGAFRSNDRTDHYGVMRARMAETNGRFYRFDFPLRYCALNLQNRETIEARIFTSTTSPEILQMRFELIAASVEYSRDLTVAEIVNGGWEYEAFVQWLVKNSGVYPALERRVVPALTLA
jgi:hypothetical protein